MKTWQSLLLLAAAVVSLACGGMGSGDGILFAGQPTAVQVGESITFAESKSNKAKDKSEARITVTAVDLHATSTHEYEKPVLGQFVTIRVEVEVIIGESDIWQRSFHLVGSDGTVWEDLVGANGFQPRLEDTTLHQGQRKSGNVVFDGDPAKLAQGKIELVNWRGTPVGYWEFSAQSATPSITPSLSPSANSPGKSFVRPRATSTPALSVPPRIHPV